MGRKGAPTSAHQQRHFGSFTQELESEAVDLATRRKRTHRLVGGFFLFTGALRDGVCILSSVHCFQEFVEENMQGEKENVDTTISVPISIMRKLYFII